MSQQFPSQQYPNPQQYPSPQYPSRQQPAQSYGAAYPGPSQVPLWQPQSRGSSARVWGWLALVLAGGCALLGIGLVLIMVGVGPGVIGFFAALIPLAMVLAAVWWMDRWEPEPRWLLAFGLLWGAGASVIIALVFNQAFALAFWELTGDPEATDVLTAVVAAPIVEESAKGLGVLLIYLCWRRYFDGVVDGLVYASVIAAGFAFTENILYFGQYIDSLAPVFIGRALFSPFAHVMFTACVGIALGIASRRRSRAAVLWLFPLGLIAAMALHALWNATGLSWVYVFVQFPMFVAAIAMVIWLRRQERNVIHSRLTEYAQAGWFAPHEVQMLSSLRLRSQARAWAGRFGASAEDAMKSFQRDATTLAFQRQRVATGRGDLRRSRMDEHALLSDLGHQRQRFAQATAGAIGR